MVTTDPHKLSPSVNNKWHSQIQARIITSIHGELVQNFLLPLLRHILRKRDRGLLKIDALP